MRKLLWSVVALVLVLLVGDVAAASFEDKRAATALQSAEHLPHPPKVHIGGFPFVTQLVTQHYGQIRVRVAHMHVPQSTRSLDFRSIDLQFEGVNASDRFRRFHADEAAGRTTLGYKSLSAALGGRIRFDGHGEVKATRTVTVKGQKIHFDVVATPVLASGQIAFLDPRVGSATGVPASAQAQLEQVFGPGLSLKSLPFDTTATKVRARPHGLFLHVSGKKLDYRS